MSYCSNCGGRLNDNGLCPNCGGVSKAKIIPNEKETVEVVACLKALFSDSPLKGVETAARTRSASVWVTFGALYMLTSIMAQIKIFTFLPSTLLNGMLDKGISRAIEKVAAGAQIEEIAPAFASLVGYSTAISLFALILISAMTSLLFTLAKERPSFSQALNISSFSTLPLSVCNLIALPLSALSVWVAAGILPLGICTAAIMYYFGIQKASEYKKSPFWFFVISVFASIIILWLFSTVFTILIF